MDTILFGAAKLDNVFWLYYFVYKDLLQEKKYHMSNLWYITKESNT
jgi:hypothetical protein